MAVEPAPQAEVRPSLNEQLSSAFDSAKVDQPEPVTPVEAPAPAQVVTEPKVDAAGRAHAPDGKFAPKATSSPSEPPAVAQTAPRPKRPDSWAKEYWDDWEKIDPRVADYLSKRESQYLQGVTTYKQEYERVKPIEEALRPYQNLVQATGGAPQFIKALADAHTILSGQDKAAALKAWRRYANEYQLPVEQLFIQGDDGKVYWNKQFDESQKPQQQAGMGPQEVEKIVQQKLAVERLNNMVFQFASEKGADGNPVRPHFEKVKATMDGLLRAGLAKDLESAYRAALAMPQHADIAETERLQREEQARAADAKAKQEAAARARANTVSPRSNAPTALVQTPSGNKGLRAQLSEAFDNANAGGRV